MTKFNGYYTVGNETFTSKYEALLHTARVRKDVKFTWCHGIWSNVDRSLLGKYSLKELYKQRALQLRDKYDHLILFYSGGSDSWTVLNTFLENNIKLDSVCVRWNMNIVGTYQPNSYDTTAFNHRSEWDLVIQKDLEWLAKYHPEIKIEIADWFKDNKLQPLTDDFFMSNNIWSQLVNLHRLNVFPDSWYYNTDKGKKVGNIYGMDKPVILHTGSGNVGMRFSDGGVFSHLVPNSQHIGEGVEYFYWAPDMPILTYEQAYQLFLFYKKNTHLRHVIDPALYPIMKGNKSFQEHADDMFDLMNHYARVALYPDWNFNKFQALKPRSPSREDKDFWFYQHPELQKEVSEWRSIYNDMLFSVHPQLLQGSRFKLHNTPFYHIGNYND